ncbi:uncharacterized protein N7482_009001 [Penicillium canariense]|uniref:Uncharacterized protein n=1 Tax=Penicillium canariense TaxID=189055 RepID=A0A9W9LI31_9EURO|nr:uncharacterized protein N7482_009001 [Penicillium canariense]KAJ5157901.1 hypothetical protein N7482_009001 [Penicillium canariense]
MPLRVGVGPAIVQAQLTDMPIGRHISVDPIANTERVAFHLDECHLGFKPRVWRIGGVVNEKW